MNLGFADFSTLAQRRFYCEEELRLNRRTAPQLYLQVLPVTGTPELPVLGGVGTAIDWVLHMRAFSQDGLWDRLAARGALGTAQIDALVEVLCDFHRLAAVAGADTDYGRPEQVRAPMRDNLSALGTLCPAGEEREGLQRLTQWEAQEFDTLRSAFVQRRADGRVRDAHGDLHLGNVTQFEGRPLLFDCLEFSAALRWTDVMSDVAFMAMDLASHGLDALSNRFVNAYVERSGDADGLRVLRYYRVHRALVRAKVAALRAAQLGATPAQAESAAASQARQHYLQAALRSSRHAAPVLMLTHGLSGSGKTTLTQDLLELSGAVRFRADVERKRLFGLAALERSDAALKAQLYSRDATRATQTRLRELAQLALLSGYSVILDATFLAAEQRQQAVALAAELGVRCIVIDFRASADTLRARVQQRVGDASEADLAVLEDQLAHAQPLSANEPCEVFVCDAEAALEPARARKRWAPLLAMLGLPPA